MRIARKDHAAEHETEIDMTPMIDVTFLLLIFFMLVSELSRIDVEALTLPEAKTTEETKPIQDRKLLIINVIPKREKVSGEHERGQPFEPEIKIQGKPYDLPALVDYLQIEVDLNPKSPNPAGGKEVSELEILIRADEWVKSECIHQIFEACTRNGIYRVRLATMEEA